MKASVCVSLFACLTAGHAMGLEVRPVSMDFICSNIPASLANAYEFERGQDPEVFCRKILASSIDSRHFPCNPEKIIDECVLHIQSKKPSQ